MKYKHKYNDDTPGESVDLDEEEEEEDYGDEDFERDEIEEDEYGELEDLDEQRDESSTRSAEEEERNRSPKTNAVDCKIEPGAEGSLLRRSRVLTSSSKAGVKATPESAKKPRKVKLTFPTAKK